MKICAGLYRSRVLKTLDGLDTRPSLSHVREAVFSMIGFKIENAVFLDLFAGSGAFSLEAISRGAKKSILVDSSKKACAIIKENIKSLGCNDKCLLIESDYKSAFSLIHDKIDICYLDPPYNAIELEKITKFLQNIMNEDGLMFFEHDIKTACLDNIDGFSKIKTKKYGKIGVSQYVYSNVSR